MTAILLLLAVIPWAGGTAPSPPPAIPGECLRSFAVRPDQPLPPELVAGDCVARCGGVLIPTTQAADMLQAEVREQLHVADIELLKLQRAGLRDRLRDQGHPWVHRLIGGAVGVTIGASIGLVVGAYYTGPGGS